MADLYKQVESLRAEIENLKAEIGSLKAMPKETEERETQNDNIVNLDNLTGLFKAQDSAPNHNPRNFKEQLVLYESSSGIDRLYINIGGSWKYINATS